MALGILGFVLAIGFYASSSEPEARTVTLTAGPFGTTRSLLASALAGEVKLAGVDLQLVETGSTSEELRQVEASRIDFAMVSGAYRIASFTRIREVAPLQVEALHLVVKPELVDSVGGSLQGLRGKTIDLGVEGSAAAGLAAAVLAFAGIPSAGTGSYQVLHLDPVMLAAMIHRGERTVLPDAVFHLGSVPSKVVLRLVQDGGYQLVTIPFAEAFRLASTIVDASVERAATDVEPKYVLDTVIPAFTYETDPAVPPAALHTLGTRLLLVANEAVAAEAVEVVLGAVFDSSFARIPYPPLDRSVFALPPRLTLHAGTERYLARDQPAITIERMNDLNDTLKFLGGILGGALFLRQWWRQRVQAGREAVFADFVLRIAEIERRVVELELSSKIDLEPLIAVQRELLGLKSEVLERFAAGDLGSALTLSELLTPVNAARDHVGSLLLHVRDNLEDKAETQGRKAELLWEEAVQQPDEGASVPDPRPRQ